MTGETNSPAIERAVGGPATRPWQFSLRAILLFTTAAAVVSSIAASRGLSSLVMSTGVIFTAFNAAGCFARLQTAKWQPRWIYLGWLLFLGSLFLPSMKGCNNQNMLGWEMAANCVMWECENVSNLATKESSRSEVWNRPIVFVNTHIFVLLLTAANLIMVAAPLLAIAWRRGRGRLLLGLLLCGAASAWLVAWKDGGSIRIGYFVWCAGMLCLLAHQRIPWRYAIASWCLAAFYLVTEFHF